MSTDGGKTDSQRAPRRPWFSTDALLDAACELFAWHGYHETSMGHIAERAGATKPTLYARLGGKEHIYTRTVEREAGAVTEHLFAAYERAEGHGLHGMVEISIMAFFKYAEQRPAGFALLYGVDQGAPVTDAGQRALAAVTDGVTDRVAAMIRTYAARRGQQRGPSADLLASIVIGLSRECARHAVETGVTDLETAGAIASSFALAGVTGVDQTLIAEIDRLSTKTANMEDSWPSGEVSIPEGRVDPQPGNRPR